jgi:hypothetical protein
MASLEARPFLAYASAIPYHAAIEKVIGLDTVYSNARVQR